jgi:hypothetical protein
VIGSTSHIGATLLERDTESPEWVDCLGAMRSVVDGLVVCPRGIYAPLGQCLSCRHLTAVQGDRDLEHFCSTGPADFGDVTEGPPAPTSWAELVIELL